MFLTKKGNMFSSFLKFSYKQNSAIRTWFLNFRLTIKFYFCITGKNLMDQKIYENHFVVHKEPSLPRKKKSASVDQGVLFGH